MKKDEILQLKITLEGITPKIWRRFQVQREMTLHQLHSVIQAVMGWSNSHLYGFTIDEKRYQDDKINQIEEFDNVKLCSSRTYKSNMLKLKQKFWYMYDFGDGWEHALTVEKLLPKERGVSYPVCLAGERNCPVEDCGSYPGYYHLLDVQKNKKHPEYKELIEDWLGGEYDPEYFNAQEANLALRRMFPNKGEKKSTR
ncbi:plasmid pRiA4b ORF-3 family protein [Candidatus Woesearchaeota archaeon]|nr:plasmid pRiA4b ORF-3 family protein [Candidatus Woesearchaeota archaeon]